MRLSVSACLRRNVILVSSTTVAVNVPIADEGITEGNGWVGERTKE
jgi:hypothetical protein